jgi:hypothetical protein
VIEGTRGGRSVSRRRGPGCAVDGASDRPDDDDDDEEEDEEDEEEIRWFLRFM